MSLGKASRRRASLAGAENPHSEPASQFTDTVAGMSLVRTCLALLALIAVTCAPAMVQVVHCAIVGTANGITAFRSGPPLGITQIRAGTALSQLGGGGGYFGAQGIFMRPDKAAVCNLGAPGSREYRVDHGWFNTACYTSVPFTDMRFGNAPRVDSGIRLDAIHNGDFSLARNIPITELLNLRFTAKFRNIFDHPRFAAPDNTVGNPTFGLVLSQVNQPRAIQFGLRLDF